MTSEPVFDATIVITTKNRKADLRRAIQSSISQEGNIEVLVVDDGSNDGTTEMIRSEFPLVHVDRQDVSSGYIVHRNRAARMARGKFLFSIDDDAEFSDSHVVQKTIADFAVSACVGAVAIPCIDVNKSPDLRQPKPDEQNPYVTSEYIGTAHAIRRDLFLQSGGYRSSLTHQGEERDLAIRLLDRGYLIRLGSSAPIWHYESPKRDTRRMDFYGRRNDVLFAWQNTPWSKLPPHLIGTAFNGIRFGFKIGRPTRMVWGILSGFISTFKSEFRREPVSANTYRLYRKLRSKGCLTLESAVQILCAKQVKQFD